MKWVLKPVSNMVHNSPCLLGQEDPLEKEMATSFTILAWEILWTKEPGRLQSMVSRSSDTTQRLNSNPVLTTHVATSHIVPWAIYMTNRIWQNDVLSFLRLGYKRHLASTMTHSPPLFLASFTLNQVVTSPLQRSTWWETKAFQDNTQWGTEASCKSHMSEK